MLSILDRYFLRELGQTMLATAIVLLAIMSGTTFAQVLKQVANGSFPASVMFQVLGLNMIEGLPTLLPLSAFLGVLYGLGRMYRESELHVLASSGMGAGGLLRPMTLLAVSTVIGWGLVTNTNAGWLKWQGYLLGPFGFGGKHGTWATASIGVVIALILGFVGTLLTRRQVRAQEQLN